MPDSTDDRDTSEIESRDSFDQVLRRVVTTNTQTLVTLEPDSLLEDRFRIRRLVGVGGMGAVYLAHDLTLVRDVAIKIHHAASGAARLRREAVAMARLAHPNVVTVFEVGEVDGRPFVAMEYVTGTTLRAWLAERARSVPEILEVLAAAGLGLAAAHDAGLVHRDFKPENVMIGSDGRARVGDFGLARDVDSEDESIEHRSDPAHASMTQTGAVIGTPAYMAPEQLAGHTIDARADQFAFCVTLWEALWKERPFAGTTPGQLASAIERGERRQPPSAPSVPARVRAALERGLATNPGDRFDTMRSLLAELTPPPRSRRRMLAAAATIAIAGGGAIAWVVSRDEAAVVSCAEAGAASIALVPRDLPAKLRAIDAPVAADRVEAALNELATRLGTGSKAACEAGRIRREWSRAIIDKSDSCFRVAALTVQRLLDFSTIDPTNRDEVVRRATLLMPDLSGCVSPTFLGASPAMPSDPAQLEALVQASADRDVAIVEIGSHRPQRASLYIERLLTAARDLPQLAPGVLLVRGLVASTRGAMVEAEKLLADAYYAARAMDDDRVLTAALIPLLKIAIDKQSTDPFVAMWSRTGVADADRLASRAPWLSARLYIAMAHVADATGDAETALRYVARIRELAPGDERVISDASSVEGAVMIWSGRVDEGSVVYERAIAQAKATMGPQHPRVGSLLSDYAVLLLGADRPEQALDVAKQAVAIVEAAADPEDRLVDGVRVNLAAVLAEINTPAERPAARALLEAARAHYVAREGERSSWVANVDMNLAAVLIADHDLAAAIQKLEGALVTTEQLLGPDRVEVAEVLYNLAAARRMDKQLAQALVAAKRCAEIYGAQRPGIDRHRTALAMTAAIENELGDHAGAFATTAVALSFTTPIQDPQVLAWPQLERGRALLAMGKLGEARSVLEAARSGYTSANLPDRVHEVETLLAKTR